MDLFHVTSHRSRQEMWRFCTVVSPLSLPVLLFLASVVIAASSSLFINQAASCAEPVSFGISGRKLAEEVRYVVSSCVLRKVFGFVEISRTFAYV